MKKTISSIIALALCIGVVVFLWSLQERHKNEPSYNIEKTISEIVLASNVRATPRNQEFLWHVGREMEYMIEGLGVEAPNVGIEQRRAAEAYLASHGFQEDLFNAFITDSASVMGYRHDGEVCILAFIPTRDEEGENESNSTTLGVQCGATNDPLEPKGTYDSSLLSALALSIGFDAMKGSTEILYQDETHIRGTVSYEGADDGKEYSSAFLAHYNGVAWTVFWNGTGAYACQQARDLEFLREMITDCTEEIVDEAVKS
ncbi:MAG: hypothetical protein WCT24_00360 [Patescibacteria group bacterium]